MFTLADTEFHEICDKYPEVYKNLKKMAATRLYEWDHGKSQTLVSSQGSLHREVALLRDAAVVTYQILILYHRFNSNTQCYTNDCYILA